MITAIHCEICLRAEERDPTGQRVRLLIEGGRRRPAAPPAKAAWLRLTQRASDEDLVGPCEGCGQPLFAPRGSQPVVQNFALQTPGGTLTWGEQCVGPDGPMDPEQAARWLDQVLAEPPVHPVLMVFQTLSMGAMLVPLVMWCGAVVIAFWFLYHAAVGNVFEYIN